MRMMTSEIRRIVGLAEYELYEAAQTHAGTHWPVEIYTLSNSCTASGSEFCGKRDSDACRCRTDDAAGRGRRIRRVRDFQIR